MRPLPLLFLLLGGAALAEGEVFRWVDSSGVVHYTDDPRAVPKGVRAETTRGDKIQVVASEPKPAAADAGQAPGPAPAAAPAVAAAPAPDPEALWRGRFRAAHEKIRNLEKELAQAKLEVQDPSGLPITARFTTAHPACCPHSGHGHPPCVVWPAPVAGTGSGVEFEKAKLKVKQLEQDLKLANDELDDLEREASQESVPRAWRR